MLLAARGVPSELKGFFDAVSLPEYIPLFVEERFESYADLMTLEPEDLEVLF